MNKKQETCLSKFRIQHPEDPKKEKISKIRSNKRNRQTKTNKNDSKK